MFSQIISRERLRLDFWNTLKSNTANLYMGHDRPYMAFRALHTKKNSKSIIKRYFLRKTEHVHQKYLIRTSRLESNLGWSRLRSDSRNTRSNWSPLCTVPQNLLLSEVRSVLVSPAVFKSEICLHNFDNDYVWICQNFHTRGGNFHPIGMEMLAKILNNS